jgi:hypothetical protein
VVILVKNNIGEENLYKIVPIVKMENFAFLKVFCRLTEKSAV